MTRIKSTLFIAALAFSSTTTWAQGVGINSTNSSADASAMLDVSANDKGILIPRVALTDSRDIVTINTPATSLLVYNSATVADVTPGFYYWSGTAWIRMTSGTDQELWTENAGNLFPTTLSNNVGINTTTPDYDLDVNGNIGVSGNIYHNEDDHTNIAFTADRIRLYAGNASNSWIDIQNSNQELTINEESSNRDFRVEGNNDINLLFADGSADRIGIGTSAPGHKLHVNAGTFTGASTTTGSKAFINHGSGAGTSSIVGFQGHARTNSWSGTTEVIGLHGLGQYLFATPGGGANISTMIGVYGEGTTDNSLGTQTAIGGKFTATGADNNYALITENGLVGLNTAAPTEQLDVDGQIRMRTGATNGYIVQGNANGVMSWVDPATVTSNSAWSLTGNSGTTPGTNFLGTTDAQDLQLRSNNRTRLTVESGGDVNLASGSIFRAATAGGAHILGAQGNTPANPAIGFHSTSAFYPQDGAGGLGMYRPNANILAFATQSAERMRINSNGNVGIGTNAPSQKLHVKGISRFQRADANNYLEISADINGVYLTSDDPGNNQKPLYLDAKPSPTVTKPIYMRTDNTTRMTVHGDGNVGIGTTSPGHKLHVNAGTFTGSSTTTGSKAFINHGSGTGTSSIVGFEGHARTNSWSGTTEVIGVHGLGEYRFAAPGGATNVSTMIGVYGEGTTDDNLGTQTAIGGKFTATGADNNYALITEDGDVGIGTSTPDMRLHVASTGDAFMLERTATQPNSYRFVFTNQPFGSATNLASGSLVLAANHATTQADLGFSTNGTSSKTTGDVQMVIKNDGDVGINTTNPSFKFDVHGNTSSLYAARIYNTNAGTDADGLRIQLARSAPNSSNYYAGFYSGTGLTFRGGIRGNGTGVSYATTSDGRLKQDIVNIDGALSIIDKMQPRHYSYIANPEAKEYGFIAQELQKVYPQAVAGNPTDDIEVDGPMMVDYGRLTPILTAAVKELNEKLTTEQNAHKASKQKIETLENELNAIKAMLKANGIK